MHRVAKKDPELDRLHDERDHLKIQISLLDEAVAPEPGKLAMMKRKLEALQQQISKHRAEA
jgi:predicted nuclease with TOPRIM domain